MFCNRNWKKVFLFFMFSFVVCVSVGFAQMGISDAPMGVMPDMMAEVPTDIAEEVAVEMSDSVEVPKVIRIAVVIFEGVLTSEVTAPVEIFGAANKEGGGPSFQISLVAENSKTILSHEGLKLIPDYRFEDSPEFDILIVPSSFNEKASVKNTSVLGFVKERGKKVDYLASNCAGAFILGAAGLLDDRKVITYVGGGEELQKLYPKALVQDEMKNHVFVDGNLVTSNGALISYEASLVLLEQVAGKALADKIAENLYFNRMINAQASSL